MSESPRVRHVDAGPCDGGTGEIGQPRPVGAVSVGLPASLTARAVVHRTRTESVEPARLPRRAAELLKRGYRLALAAAHHTGPDHPDGPAVGVVYLFVAGPPDSRVELRLRLDPGAPAVPTLARLSFPAGRFECAMRDRYGVVPLDHPLPRHLVHRAPYPLSPGEGAEELFPGHAPAGRVALAERVDGGTVVGHALAYCLAVEEAAGAVVLPEAARMRAILLELERLHGHVADLGALCDDAGRADLHARALRIRETLLRLNENTTGHRLLRGGVVLGGASLRRVPDPARLESAGADVRELVGLAVSDPIVRDRFTGTAVLTRRQARDIGALGYVARASGLGHDARTGHPFTDLGDDFTVPTRDGGDVLARFLVRADEVDVSVRLIAGLSAGLSPGFLTGWPPITPTRPANTGVGIVEGRHGTIVHRAELDTDGRLAHVKIADPAFFNRPALPVALRDTTAPDRPLASRSLHLP